MMLGEVKDESVQYKRQTRQETSLLFIVCFFIVLLGVYPKPILEISEKSVLELIQGMSN